MAAMVRALKSGFHHIRIRDTRAAVAVLCLLLVCYFAGISAGHNHALPQTSAVLAQSATPCALCAVAFQGVLLFTVPLLVLHSLSVPRERSADPKSKSTFTGTSIFFRPPPSSF